MLRYEDRRASALHGAHLVHRSHDPARCAAAREHRAADVGLPPELRLIEVRLGSSGLGREAAIRQRQRVRLLGRSGRIASGRRTAWRRIDSWYSADARAAVAQTSPARKITGDGSPKFL